MGRGALVIGEQSETEVLRKVRDALGVRGRGLEFEFERAGEISASGEAIHSKRAGELVRCGKCLVVKTRCGGSEFEEHQAFHYLWLIAVPQVVQQFLCRHL